MDIIPQREGGQATGLKELADNLPEGLIMAEIGSYAGESAEIFLQSGKVEKLYCIDPWSQPSSHMRSAEKVFDAKVEKWNGKIVKMKGVIDHFIDKLPELDFVYIDADHSYLSTKNDIYKSFTKLKPGGAIAGHGYFDNYKERVMKAVDEIFGKPDKVYPDTSWFVKLKNK